MAEELKAEEDVQSYDLIPNSELRFEIESKTEKVSLQLKAGLAELFGTELAPGKSYEFRCGAKVAVYSWKGCTLVMRGKPDVAYIAKETPMTMYLNCHAALEQMRKNAEETDKRGPICMVVGPGDVGKSTITKILCNYAVRMGRRPVFVDLDVGQGSIGMPGSIGAMLIERPAAIDGGFSQQAPLVYHFGHTAPDKNIPLFNTLVTKLADVVAQKLEANKKAGSSGVIINTCGWVRNAGYKLILHIAQAFEVDVILVLDQERLYNELQRDLPSFINLVLLPKSRGVVERSRQNRAENREARINEYFYGTLQAPLYPHSFEVRLSDVKIFKIGAPALPDSCLPVGMKPEDNLTKLVPVTAGSNLVNHILAVSFAASPDENVIQTNVAGFICVTKVDSEKGVMTVVSPQPRPLPDTLLLMSDVQFVDSHA